MLNLTYSMINDYTQIPTHGSCVVFFLYKNTFFIAVNVLEVFQCFIIYIYILWYTRQQ